MSHACLYIANTIEETTLPEMVCVPSADVEHFCTSAFSIKDARTLGERAHVRPVADTKRVFLIHFQTITVEAQNALLKLFEEPPDTAIFYVVVAREDMLLPTLRSRLLLKEQVQHDVDRDAMRAFLKMTIGDRMNEIAKRTKAKDSAWIEAIVAGAEAFTGYVKGDSKKRTLESVMLVRQYLNAPSSSKKMLLEELALSLPQVKK